MECSQYQDESTETSEALIILLPVIIQVEEKHLWLSCLQYSVSKFLNLQTRLEGKLQLTAFDDDVGEVEEMDFERVKHSLPGDNNLFGLLLDWETSDEGSHFLCSLPLGQLTQSLLACPHTGVDDLEEELARLGIEDEDGPIDWLGRQISLKSLVDGHSVHIGVIHKPNDLVGEQLCIVLRVQIWLSGLTRVELQTLPDSLSEDIQGWIGLHNLGSGLLQ
jgi:hypothetical protein